MVPVYAFFVAALALIQSISSNAFAPSYQTRSAATTILFSQNGRRDFMSKAAIAAVPGVCRYHSLQGKNTVFELLHISYALISLSYYRNTPLSADVDTEDFLKSGMVSMPMGVSGQAGKTAN